MADSNIGVIDFLEKMRKERDELIALVESLEKRLGIVSASSMDHVGNQDGAPPMPKVKVSIDSVPVGFFHNMSQPLAAEKLLRLNPGQPLTTQDIIDSFRKSGMDLNPKNATTILYTALSRSPKFERVAGKAWGLAEWYPEKKRKTEKESQQHPEQPGELKP
jgi:hypothetical protein